MKKKYKLTRETIKTSDLTVLHRIVALRDFGNVKKGDKGGFVEGYKNLSQIGNCWIFDNAKVYNNARICNDARIFHNAEVCDNVKVYDNSKILDNAKVYNDARIYDNSYIHHDTRISGNSKIYGNTVISDKSSISGNAIINNSLIFDNTLVCGDAMVINKSVITGMSFIKNATIDNAKVFNSNIDTNALINIDITDSKNYICIGPVSEGSNTLTFIKNDFDNNIYVNGGISYGTIEEFEEKIKEIYKNSTSIMNDYLDAIEFIKKKFYREDKQLPKTKQIVKIPLLNKIGEPNVNGIIISKEEFQKCINSDYYKEMIDKKLLRLTYGGTAGEFLLKNQCSINLPLIADYTIGYIKEITEEYIIAEIEKHNDLLDKRLELGFKVYITYLAKQEDNYAKDIKIMYCSIGPDIMKGDK